MHHRVPPFSGVLAPIRIFIGACSVKFTFQKLTLVSTTICIGYLTKSRLKPVVELTFVSSSIRPYLGSLSLLFVLMPLSLILCAVGMGVNSKTMGQTLLPFAFICVTSGILQTSRTVHRILSPETLKKWPIWPQKLAKSNSFPVFVNLSAVICTINF